MFRYIVSETYCFITGGLELSLRLIGIESVVCDKNHMVDLRHLFCGRKCAEIACTSSVEHDHQLGILFSEFKVFHVSVITFGK